MENDLNSDKARKVVKLWDKAVNAVKANDLISKYIEIYAKDSNWKIIGLDPQPEIACLYYTKINSKGDEVLGYFTIDLNDESALENTYDLLNNWLMYRGSLTYNIDLMNEQEANIIQYGKNLQFYIDDVYSDFLDGNACTFTFCISDIPLKDYPKPGEFISIERLYRCVEFRSMIDVSEVRENEE